MEFPRRDSACDLIIVGASARAAVQSACRAGLRPFAVDLFGDRDLRYSAAFRKIGSFTELIDTVRDWPSVPWMYTGGLENEIDLVRTIQRERALWGCDSAALEKLRDPSWLREQLPFAKTVLAHESNPTHGRWLLKTQSSAGGLGVAEWRGQSISANSYLQQFVVGDSVSGLFVVQSATWKFMGMTRQLIGESWLHGRPFHYCGNIGPLDMPNELRANWDALGPVFVTSGARGVIGVDAILGDGQLTIVEVNPRYPASSELFEFATGRSIVRDHISACREELVPAMGPIREVIGKAIFFAPEDLRFPIGGPWDAVAISPPSFGNVPEFADIPQPCEFFAAGAPVISLMVQGRTAKECETKLREAAICLGNSLSA